MFEDVTLYGEIRSFCFLQETHTMYIYIYMFFYIHNKSSQTKLKQTAPNKATSRIKLCFMMFCAKINHFTWVFPRFLFFSPWIVVVVFEDDVSP